MGTDRPGKSTRELIGARRRRVVQLRHGLLQKRKPNPRASESRGHPAAEVAHDDDQRVLITADLDLDS